MGKDEDQQERDLAVKYPCLLPVAIKTLTSIIRLPDYERIISISGTGSVAIRFNSGKFCTIDSFGLVEWFDEPPK